LQRSPASSGPSAGLNYLEGPASPDPTRPFQSRQDSASFRTVCMIYVHLGLASRHESSRCGQDLAKAGRERIARLAERIAGRMRKPAFQTQWTKGKALPVVVGLGQPARAERPGYLTDAYGVGCAVATGTTQLMSVRPPSSKTRRASVRVGQDAVPTRLFACARAADSSVAAR